MQHVLLYGWLFIGSIVYIIDALKDWLAALGISGWLAAICVFGLFAWKILDEWSIDTEKRIRTLEKRLGIEYKQPVRKRSVWLHLLAWFLAGFYLLGKAFQSEGVLAIAGIVVSTVVLLLCLLSLCCLLDEGVRERWRRLRGR